VPPCGKRVAIRLDEHHEAQEQVGFADRILISESDLVSTDEVRELATRLKRMNPRAPITAAHSGATPIEDLLDIRSGSLGC